MMAALLVEQQQQQFLIQPDEDSFEQDLLHALLTNRKQELAKCQARLLELDDRTKQALEEEWRPMLRAIRLLLKEESSYLGKEN